jgi:hypothetical protein
MPFYKSSVEKTDERGIKLIAVLPNSREESQQYLKENGVEIREARQAKLDSVSVRETPTLMLINGKGEVENFWIGKLPSQKESEVIGSF